MMRSKRAVKLIMLLFGLLSICPFKAEGKTSLSWSGHITGITSFGSDAVPTGISQGDLIRGNLTFEASQYSSTSNILGNISAGNVYRYGNELKQTINIGTWEWIIKGADISLINSLSYPQLAFDVFSTSENNAFDSFPNYVGTFEYGFALFDSISPLSLFDSYEIDNLHLALDEVSSATGFLTTRQWDSAYNIVNGYYITFDIDQTSYIPILEPTVPKLIFPLDNQSNLKPEITFIWQKSTAPDGDGIAYNLYLCEDENFTTGCFNKESIASLEKEKVYRANSDAGLFLFGIIAIAGIKKRKKIAFLLVNVILALLLISCGSSGNGSGGGSSDNVSVTISGLHSNTTYFWKVGAITNKGATTESEMRSFTTQ